MFGSDLMVIAADAIADAVVEISVHTAGSDVYSDTDESTAARVTPTWLVGADGDLVIPLLTFAGGTPGGPATRLAYRLASGAIVGGILLPPGSVFSVAGNLEVTNLLENAITS